jgi:phosphate transport system substrate-binding protein
MRENSVRHGLVLMSLVSVAAACGSGQPGGTSAAPTPTIATAPPTSKVTLWETGSKDLYPLMDAWLRPIT